MIKFILSLDIFERGYGKDKYILSLQEFGKTAVFEIFTAELKQTMDFYILNFLSRFDPLLFQITETVNEKFCRRYEIESLPELWNQLKAKIEAC